MSRSSYDVEPKINKFSQKGFMPDYKSLQKKLVSELEQSFAEGKSRSTVVEMQKDYFDDDQICLTSITRIDPAIQLAIFEKIIGPLKSLEPQHYYYTPESMHLTIKNIRTIHKPPLFDQTDVEKVDQLFSEIIPKYESFGGKVEDVVLFPTSLSVMVYMDGVFAKLIRTLDQGLGKIGVPDNKKYISDKVFWGNITVCRFTKTPSSPFIEKVKSVRNLKFGQMLIDKISLITSNIVLNPKYLKTIAEYQLIK